MSDLFETALSRRIWEQRYQYRRGDRPVDADIVDTWQRVARAAASVEGGGAALWEARFAELLGDFRFLP